MLSIENYAGFVAAAAALCLTPGIDTVYILTRTIAGGRAEGLASALGINTGLVVHTVLVAAGLSLVLAASPVAFGAIKIAGAAYLVVMGVRSVFSGGASFSTAAGEKGTSNGARASVSSPAAPGAPGAAAAGASTAAPAPLARTYAQGVLTNVLNPKIILFFLALLPQFIAVPNEHGPLPFLALGLTYTALSTLWTVVIVAIAAPFSRLLARSERAGRVTAVVSGVVYVALGGMIFFTA